MNQYEDIAGPIVPRRIARQHPAYGLGGGMLLVIAGLVAMLVAFFVDTVMSWDLLRPDLPRETRLMLHGEVALAILAYVTGYCALARSALFPWLFSGLTAATLLLAGYSIAVVEMGLSARSPGLFQVTACLLGILLPYVVLSRRVAVTYRRDVGDWRPPGMAPAVEPANEVAPAVFEPAPPMEPAAAAAALRPEPAGEPPPAPEPRISPEPKASAAPKPSVRPAAQDIDFDIPPLAQPIIRRDKARDPFEALLKKQDDPAKPAPEKPAAPPAAEANEPPPVAPSFDPVFDDATPAGRVEPPPVRPAAAPAGGRYDPFGDDLFAAAAAVSPTSDPFFADPAPASSAPGGGSVPPPTFAAATPPPVTPPPLTPPPATAPAVAAAPPIPPPPLPPKPKAKPASNFDWLSAPSAPPPAAMAPAAAPVPPPVSPPPAAPAAPSGPFGAPSYGVPPARPAPPPPPSAAEAAPVGDVAPRLYEQLSRLRRIAGTTGQ